MKMTSLPIIPLRDIIVFPPMMIQFDVGRDSSLKALEYATSQDERVLLVSQRDAEIESPTAQDLYAVGTVVKIKKLVHTNPSTVKILIEGENRAIICKTYNGEFLSADVEILDEPQDIVNKEAKAMLRLLHDRFKTYGELHPKLHKDILYSVLSSTSQSVLIDLIAANIQADYTKKQMILEEKKLENRMMILLDILQEEIEMLKLEEEILKKVKKQIDQQQKEYYLREQLKIIQEELGEQTDLKKEIETYKKQLQVKNFSKEIILKLEKEMDRLFKIPTHSPESNMVRTYIETVLELPSIYTEKENINLKKIKRILDEAHYGLTEVKERILEYLAVRQMSDNLVAPIICLVGPPGIGKTSIVKSVAEAIGRNYVRVSLGGVRDEAEIRGHRRTYIGAQPGRIVNVLCQAKTNNPVILLDEIDKMIGDFRGDPAAALLEVLDKEQNTTFRDHYLEIPLDLSQVMFMVTANTLTTLPRPLLDRMEIIEINGYSLFEKQEITKQYLLPKQLKLHGLQKGKCKIASPVFKQLIEGYTKEAGVRQLERQIATICRKCVKELIENEKDSLTISFKKVEEYLGPAPYVYHIKNEIAEIGVVRGLAWTAVGGDTLSIEVNLMPGKGHLELTGNIGKVMKESAQAAMSYIRSQEKILNLPPNFYKEMDMHIHIPEGAVPKDGPSAGITMAAAMISALLLKTIRPDIAMTGEITIRGRVLGIGGLKEKILAAKRAGIYEVIVPAQNEKEIQKLDANILEQMKVIYVKTMEDVLKHVFVAETEVKI